MIKTIEGKRKCKNMASESKMAIILITEVNSLSVPSQSAVFDHEPSQYVNEHIVYDFFKQKQ